MDTTLSALQKEAMKSPNGSYCLSVAFAIICLLKNGASAGVVATLAENWSTNSQTKVHANLFDEVITRTSRGVDLVKCIVAATKNGRNDFTRAEAYRLAGRLYKEIGEEEGGREKLIESGGVMKQGLDSCFGEGGVKTKRIRDIIGCVQQIAAFCGKVNTVTCWSVLGGEGFKKGLENMKNSEKGSLSTVADNLLRAIDEGLLVAEDNEEEKTPKKGDKKASSSAKKSSKK